MPQITAIIEKGLDKPGEVEADYLCYLFTRIAGVGCSTYSKLLYFSEVEALEGKCLIYDQMVMRSISESQEPAFQSIREQLGSPIRTDGQGKKSYRVYTPAVQERTYSEFIRAAGIVAAREGCHPELIEQRLFLNAPNGRIA
jgi:hypothetical protein